MCANPTMFADPGAFGRTTDLLRAAITARWMMDDIESDSWLPMAAALQQAMVDKRLAIDGVKHIIARSIRMGGQHGKNSHQFIRDAFADIVEEKRILPVKSGPPVFQNFIRDWKLWFVATGVAEHRGLHLYSNNEAFKGVTAADAVALVAGLSVDVVVKACKKFRRLYRNGTGGQIFGNSSP
jgi:hypothetical protein